MNADTSASGETKKSSSAKGRPRRLLARDVSGDTTHIEYEDEFGRWHTESSEGGDRPDADVVA